ncbi:putative rhamnogalacturonate lyase C [Lachnellula cervina]|uniref:Putative rhamnogalacturonate lyase C n=1 Tax=Lachnellula cervina TaxID=1316786 RepID=A0A7D8YV94_9HELO|nr:putative rhamnogalacturonate lyase C [Lachnellula cervina]
MTDPQPPDKTPPALRKTRFVCISDTHNATPGGAFQLPKGDVLLHCGDMTNQGSFSELQKTLKWIEEADFEVKIVVAGNHDITLDTEFYNQYGSYFHNQEPQDPAKCIQLIQQSPSIIWLKHEAAIINLSSPAGPQTTFKVFGSPYSPAKDRWAFGYCTEEADSLWDRIPLDSDIVITHTPPKYHCDERKDGRAAGCDGLRNALWRVRPRLSVCGHVHEGRGSEIVRWDLQHTNIKYKEDNVERWEDPGHGNKKMSLIDLSSKKRKPIENDGSRGDWNESNPEPSGNPPRSLTGLPDDLIELSSPSEDPELTIEHRVSQITTSLLEVPPPPLSAATRGQGGVPPSQRCDIEALSGRMGRKETCIINAAIMASSWPHGIGGGKKFNKPIVVDIDLPSRHA